MKKSNLSRMIPILFIVVVVVVAIGTITMIIRNATGGNKPKEEVVTQIDESEKALVSSGADRSIRMSVRGQLVADEEFNSYQITISPTKRKIETFAGYLERSLENESLENNIKAYEELVFALNKAQMMKGVELKGADNDLRGVCASGNLYVFEILKNNTPEKMLWTSTCKLSKGSLVASYDQLRKLFLNQIPNSAKLIKKISDTKKF